MGNFVKTNLILRELRVDCAVAVRAKVERVGHPLGAHHPDGRRQGGVARATPQQRGHVLLQLLPADRLHGR